MWAVALISPWDIKEMISLNSKKKQAFFRLSH
jgi:hypothetical protein